jgi:hypothetical protein
VNLLTEMPCSYIWVGVIWSAYQGVRGAVETDLFNADKKWTVWQKWLVLYVHDFAFRFVCAAAGFVALFAAYATLKQVNLGGANAGVLVFVALAFLLGVIGVGGQLHHAVLFGKLPGVK